MKIDKIAFEGFLLDPANARLWRGDTAVSLPPKAFNALCCLAERRGELVTKDELLGAVWPNLNVTESSLSIAIKSIRAALNDDAKAPRYIETVTKRGYRFIAPVKIDSAADAASLREERAWAPFLGSAPRPQWRVGRKASLETLDSLLQRSLAGNRQVVFITGEAGIGKTTFVQMAMERMASRGAGVLWGSCIERFGSDEAFLPLIEALLEFCRGTGGPVMLKLLREHAPTWLAQMPGFLDAKDRASLQSDVFGATRERMLREFCDLLEVLSADRPWIVILEDLHWSDLATLDLLSRFARGDRKAAVLILATYRPMDVLIGGHPTRTLHHDLQIHGCSKEVALDRLSPGDIEHYLALRFGRGKIIGALAQRLFQRTQGQPLFVVALVDYFIAQGALVEVDGNLHVAPEEAIPQDGLPRDLHEMISRQIDRLETVEQRFLEFASAAGAEFSAAVVACAASGDALEVEGTFEGLARKGHVVNAAGASEWPDGTVSGRYEFQHALYQEVLAQRLAPGQRIQTHRRVAERLEAGYGAQTADIASVLALHFEEGRDYAKAVRYLAQAAENAAKRFSTREAVNYLTRALGLVDRLASGERLRVQATLLQQRAWVRRSAEDFLGSIADLKTMISCAVESKELLLEVNGLLDLTLVNLYADRPQCLPVAARAAARSQGLDEVVVARAHANKAFYSLFLEGWRDENAAICHQAVKQIAEGQDVKILMRRYSVKGVVNYLCSNYQESALAGTRAKELAQTIGDVYFFALGNSIEARALLLLGQWRLLQQSLSAALVIVERNTNRIATGRCYMEIAGLHLHALDFEGAKLRCENVLELRVVDADPFVFFLSRTCLGSAYLGLGDYPSALDQFKQILQRMDVDGIAMETVVAPIFYHDLCEYYLAVGDLPRAREQAMRLYEIVTPPPDRNHLALTHRMLARIAMAEGDLDDARAQLLHAITIVEQGEFPLAAWRIYATAAHLHGRLGDARKSAEFRRRAEKIIQTLAANFDRDHPLRASLLAGFTAEIGQPRTTSAADGRGSSVLTQHSPAAE